MFSCRTSKGTTIVVFYNYMVVDSWATTVVVLGEGNNDNDNGERVMVTYSNHSFGGGGRQLKWQWRWLVMEVVVVVSDKMFFFEKFEKHRPKFERKSLESNV